MPNNHTIGMISLGCSKNQVDAERMLFSLREEGYSISPSLSDCDVVIVNTCGFIEDAKKESLEAIFEMATEKKQGRLRGIVVTGCLSERYREEFVRELPEVDAVLGIGCNRDIASAVEAVLAGEKRIAFGPKEDLSLEGERVLANPSYYAYLKLAEGCDNRCSYCAIPGIRGGFRSRPIELVVEEAKQLAAKGVVELNVVAQDTSRYGEDLYGKRMLPALLEQLCEIEGIRWVRILYCYPDRVTDELLRVMREQPKIVKYMDLPLQHASAKVLREMNRRGGRESLTALMEHIREEVPGVVLRTTFITGFPGESEEDFAELCRFVEEIRFDRLGCFVYSREEDTPAYDFPDQVEVEVARRRADHIMEAQARIAEEIARDRIGQRLTVLAEGFDPDLLLYFGRGEGDAPDIDTKIYFSAEEAPTPGAFVEVLITGADGYDLIGERKETP